MRAGTLRHTVDIQAVALQTADSYGQQAEAWAAIASSVPAEVKYLSGIEAYSAKQIQPEITHQVMIRYNGDVTTLVRFKFGSRYLYPVSVAPDTKNRQMVCLCKEQL
jgi:SPP1 family predicted phage head-tail adaptor